MARRAYSILGELCEVAANKFSNGVNCIEFWANCSLSASNWSSYFSFGRFYQFYPILPQLYQVSINSLFNFFISIQLRIPGYCVSPIPRTLPSRTTCSFPQDIACLIIRIWWVSMTLGAQKLLATMLSASALDEETRRCFSMIQQ